jgi:ectoine hydroxylase-related dioxygenase (phytanoyl-CoA dioxygenase family)
MFELFEVFHNVGLAQLVRSYLGERPALAIDKCTLPRVGQISGTDWHQDGAFLGKGIRTINVWMALSDCGRDAPGLDVVPCRLHEIVETGTEEAMFPWSVGPGVVERVSAATVCRPTFEAGDVLLFDEMFLHRTAIDPSMTQERYAVETWFFAPSVFPDHYLPLAF